MKKVSLVLVIFLTSIFAEAQTANFQQAMGQAMQSWSKAEGPADFNDVANSFSRIAAAQDTSYLPDYYAAYVQLIESFYLTDAAKRDQLIGEAQKHIDRADKLNPGSSEVEVMKGYALMAKMIVEPSTRGQQYSPMIMQSFGKARAMDPANPRAVIMMARMSYGSAQFFGSGVEEACAMAQQGKDMLSKEVVSGFEPHWGEYEANDVLKNCKK